MTAKSPSTNQSLTSPCGIAGYPRLLRPTSLPLPPSPIRGPCYLLPKAPKGPTNRFLLHQLQSGHSYGVLISCPVCCDKHLAHKQPWVQRVFFPLMVLGYSRSQWGHCSSRGLTGLATSHPRLRAQGMSVWIHVHLLFYSRGWSCPHLGWSSHIN